MFELPAMASFSQVTDLIGVVIWPLVAVFAIVTAVTERGRRLLRPILRRIRKISGGGFALELSAEAAAATKADVEGALRDFSHPLQDEFERLAYAEDVRHRLARAVDDLLQKHELPEDSEQRATVHVSDALYADALYQLVDYWPTGGGSGRRFSTRFGMLGRAWRLEESLYEKDIATAPKDLISEWGMTREQAEGAGRGRRSFFCGVMRYEDSLVGVLYLDAAVQDAFPEDIIDRFAQSDAAKNMADAVGRVHRGIASRGPGIKVLHSD